MQYWAVWYPKAAATGLLVARARVDSTPMVLFHAAPDVITVEVSDDRGNLQALGKDLPKTRDSPISRLDIQGTQVTREDLWPAAQWLLGATVLLPGGEAGVLKSWWNSDDMKEWRWEVEFYNSIR